MKFQMGELFCGPGGMALGAHQAADAVSGIELQHRWANDYDKDTCATYRRNIPGATEHSVIHEDVRKLDIAALEAIDGFAFGFPCNDFSVVGEQKGMDGTFGPLYEYGARVLDEKSPKWFVAENVGGLRNSNDGLAFVTILDRLAKSGSMGGYRLYPHFYKFEAYGVPQRRHRVLIVGIRRDLNIQFGVPSTDSFAGINNSVGHRLTVPPIDPLAANHELTRQSPTVVRRLQHILPGQNAFTASLPEELRLNVAGAKISQIYKRLERDKPSYTVTGSGGGGTHVYHWEEPRALTNRERARIQTFPDNFEFCGSKESVRKQVGMAVPAEGAKVVFEALFKSFLDISYPTVECNLEHVMSEPEALPDFVNA